MTQHEIFISVGSNIERDHHTRVARIELERAFSDVLCSTVYESEPVGFKGDAFFNLVVRATTTMPLESVCRCLKDIEAKNGRLKGEKKYSSRTLDLDLLTFDNKIVNEPVELPRGEILDNAFVLLPLAEIAPAKVHPVVLKSYSELWANYDKSSQKLWPADFTWSVSE